MNTDFQRILLERLSKSFSLTNNLYESIKENDLKLKIPDVPSNTIGEQAWCIIGARESYLRAIKESKWKGFTCSLKDSTNKEEICALLVELTQKTGKLIKTLPISSEQVSFAIDLLEHEAQHHGQLIRFFYSNKISFPESWNKRYTV